MSLQVVHDNQCPVGGPGDPTVNCEATGARRRRGLASWGSVGSDMPPGRRKAGSATGGAAASDGEGAAGAGEDYDTDALTIDDFMGIYVLLAFITAVSLVWAMLDKRRCLAGRPALEEVEDLGSCENIDCQATLKDPSSVVRCGRCGEASYCSVECQTR